VGSHIDAAGAAHLVLAQGVAQLDPARAVFDGMLAGWCAQQRSRLLNELGSSSFWVGYAVTGPALSLPTMR
jgi:hypothetical protein